MTTIHRIGTGVALLLALATTASPASARVLDVNANGSNVPAGGVSTQARNPAPGGSAIVLGRMPSASPAARPTGAGRHVRVAGAPRCPVRGPCISPNTGLTQGLSEQEAAAPGDRGGAVASATGSPTEGSSTTGHSQHAGAASAGETFEWGDAGIGAAGMLLLVTAGVGVAVTTRRRRITAS